MAWTFVQTASDFNAGTATLTLSAPVGSGHFLNGGGLLPTPVKITSITDDKGNAYDTVPGSDGDGNGAGGHVLFGFRSHDVITNGPTVLTFHTTAAPAGFFFKLVEEWAPPAGTSHVSLDGHTNFLRYYSTNPNTMVGSGSSSPFVTRHNGAFLWGFVWSDGAMTASGSWSAQTVGAGGGTMNTYANSTMGATANNTNAFTFSSNTSSNIGAYGIFFGTAPVAVDSWIPVQQGMSKLNNVGSNVITIKLPAPATPGNFIFGGFGATSGGTISIVDDLGGTNYVVLDNLAAFGHACWASTGLLTTAPSSFTITSTLTDPTVGICAEFRPLPGASNVVVDSHGIASYLTGPTITTLTNTITPTRDNCIIYTWISSGGSQGDVPVNGLNMLSNWGEKNTDAYVIQGTAAPFASSWKFDPSSGIIICGVALAAGFAYTVSITEAGAATDSVDGGARATSLFGDSLFANDVVSTGNAIFVSINEPSLATDVIGYPPSVPTSIVEAGAAVDNLLADVATHAAGVSLMAMNTATATVKGGFFGDASGLSQMASISGKNGKRSFAAKQLGSKSEYALRQVMVVTAGAAPGATATYNYPRIEPVPEMGGKRTVQQVALINRATTAGDVTEYKNDILTWSTRTTFGANPVPNKDNKPLGTR